MTCISLYRQYNTDGIHGCKPYKLNKVVIPILTLKTELRDVDTKQLEEIEKALCGVHCNPKNDLCNGCFCQLVQDPKLDTVCLFVAVHRELENRKRKSHTMGECVANLMSARDENSTETKTIYAHIM